MFLAMLKGPPAVLLQVNLRQVAPYRSHTFRYTMQCYYRPASITLGY